MKKTAIFLIIISLVVFLLAGCSAILDKNDSDDTGTAILAGNTADQKPLSCIVYYSLSDDDYLIGIQRLVSVPETKRTEEIILQELIAGPYATESSLMSTINPNTRIVSISENNGLIFLTLSSQFFEPLAGTPENWQDDEAWYDEVMKQRRLALYSLVNTLTQTGKYSKMQLFIDYDDSGQGTRPTRAEVGLIDKDPDQLLEPIGRNADYIYKPETAVNKFFDKFSEKNWSQSVLYIDMQNTDIKAEDVSSEFSILDLTLIDYSITSTTTSYDGKSAIVTIDYFIRAKDGSEYTNTNVSILVNLSNNIWKISYVSVNQFLEVSNG